MKNKIKTFTVFLLSVILIGISYLYISSENQTATTIPEEERILVKDSCKIAGCSGQYCIDENEGGEGGGSSCNRINRYACYRDTYTTCERQSSGKCGWTNTPELKACLKSPPL